jgi:hypothetical protein
MTFPSGGSEKRLIIKIIKGGGQGSDTETGFVTAQSWYSTLKSPFILCDEYDELATEALKDAIIADGHNGGFVYVPNAQFSVPTNQRDRSRLDNLRGNPFKYLNDMEKARAYYGIPAEFTDDHDAWQWISYIRDRIALEAQEAIRMNPGNLTKPMPIEDVKNLLTKIRSSERVSQDVV